MGDVLSLLWFKRSLPKYCTRFIEMCIMLCADHGPCVSGAHNTIVTARAGKDLVSCLVAGEPTADVVETVGSGRLLAGLGPLLGNDHSYL